MNEIEELNKRLNHVKVLMDALGMNMEELMAQAGVLLDCSKCPIKSICDSHKYYSCSLVWEKYLKGEFDETS